MKKNYLTMFLIFAISTLSACASIVDGSSQQLTFNSNPSGAEISINGETKGVTPLTIDVKRAEKTQVTIKKEGFGTQEQILTTKVNGMFWGNILIGGALGSSTDSSTGAITEYSPGAYLFELNAE